MVVIVNFMSPQTTLSLAQLFGDSANALAPIGGSRNVLRQGDRSPQHDHTHIETIDVKCDQRSGMLVTVQFEDDFRGVIYSQGYHNDPKCRYVQANQGGRQFTFTVPYTGCGSKPSCAVCASVDNVLVIQTDEDVQEAWDTARRISCSQSEQQQNTIIFKPFVVDQLEVVNVPTSTGGVECWMDIQRGTYPSISPIPSIIKIGEALSVLVYLRDPKGDYDVSVKDCYAFDSADYDAPTTARLQLSDKNGCSRKKKLFGLWQKTTQTGSSGATLVVHNSIKAFKFPDRMQVFLKCDIEICRGGCGPQVCAEENLISAVQTSTSRPTGPTRGRPIPTTTQPPVVPTRGRRPPVTQRPTLAPQLPPSTAQPPRRGTRPPRPIETTPSYTTSAPAPSRRTRPPNTRPPTIATTEFICKPGSTDDRCNDVIGTQRPDCSRGSRDPRCRSRGTRPTAAPSTPSTQPPLRCFPGSTDPRCPTTFRPSVRPTTRPPPPPPRTTQRTTTTTEKEEVYDGVPNCLLRSDDPRCSEIAIFLPEIPQAQVTTRAPIVPTVPTFFGAHLEQPTHDAQVSCVLNLPQLPLFGATQVPAIHAAHSQHLHQRRSLRIYLQLINQIATLDLVILDAQRQQDHLQPLSLHCDASQGQLILDALKRLQDQRQQPHLHLDVILDLMIHAAHKQQHDQHRLLLEDHRVILDRLILDALKRLQDQRQQPHLHHRVIQDRLILDALKRLQDQRQQPHLRLVRLPLHVRHRAILDRLILDALKRLQDQCQQPQLRLVVIQDQLILDALKQLLVLLKSAIQVRSIQHVLTNRTRKRIYHRWKNQDQQPLHVLHASQDQRIPAVHKPRLVHFRLLLEDHRVIQDQRIPAALKPHLAQYRQRSHHCDAIQDQLTLDAHKPLQDQCQQLLEDHRVIQARLTLDAHKLHLVQYRLLLEDHRVIQDQRIPAAHKLHLVQYQLLLEDHRVIQDQLTLDAPKLHLDQLTLDAHKPLQDQCQQLLEDHHVIQARLTLAAHKPRFVLYRLLLEDHRVIQARLILVAHKPRLVQYRQRSHHCDAIQAQLILVAHKPRLVQYQLLLEDHRAIQDQLTLDAHKLHLVPYRLLLENRRVIQDQMTLDAHKRLQDQYQQLHRHLDAIQGLPIYDAQLLLGLKQRHVNLATRDHLIQPAPDHSILRHHLPVTLDHRIPTPYRPTSTNPPATYLPPFPAESNARLARHLSPETLSDINALADVSDHAGTASADTVSTNVDVVNSSAQISAVESRVKRDVILANELDGESTREIISITLNIKGYQFEPES
uniref:ZP domain-containing protein n=1 Tax=Anopheles albimanus TaxID=7167 RepID=A0A182FSI4_ANOAL